MQCRVPGGGARADLSKGGETVMYGLVSLLVHQAGVCPGIVTVVGESERPGPQPVVHPQHRQASPDTVPRLHWDHTGYLACLVSLQQTFRHEVNMRWSHYTSHSPPEEVTYCRVEEYCSINLLIRSICSNVIWTASLCWDPQGAYATHNCNGRCQCYFPTLRGTGGVSTSGFLDSQHVIWN